MGTSSERGSERRPGRAGPRLGGFRADGLLSRAVRPAPSVAARQAQGTFVVLRRSIEPRAGSPDASGRARTGRLTAPPNRNATQPCPSPWPLTPPHGGSGPPPRPRSGRRWAVSSTWSWCGSPGRIDRPTAVALHVLRRGDHRAGQHPDPLVPDPPRALPQLRRPFLAVCPGRTGLGPARGGLRPRVRPRTPGGRLLRLPGAAARDRTDRPRALDHPPRPVVDRHGLRSGFLAGQPPGAPDRRRRSGPRWAGPPSRWLALVAGGCSSGALGLGDRWLLAMEGAFLGVGMLLPIVFLASVQGSIIGLTLRAARPRARRTSPPKARSTARRNGFPRRTRCPSGRSWRWPPRSWSSSDPPGSTPTWPSGASGSAERMASPPRKAVRLQMALVFGGGLFALLVPRRRHRRGQLGFAIQDHRVSPGWSGTSHRCSPWAPPPPGWWASGWPTGSWAPRSIASTKPRERAAGVEFRTVRGAPRLNPRSDLAFGQLSGAHVEANLALRGHRSSGWRR